MIFLVHIPEFCNLSPEFVFSFFQAVPPTAVLHCCYSQVKKMVLLVSARTCDCRQIIPFYFPLLSETEYFSSLGSPATSMSCSFVHVYKLGVDVMLIYRWIFV